MPGSGVRKGGYDRAVGLAGRRQGRGWDDGNFVGAGGCWLGTERLAGAGGVGDVLSE